MSERLRLRQVTIQGSFDRGNSRREQAHPLCFDELIIVIDELADLAHTPETRFEGFDPIAPETIGLLEYARVRRLRPRIRIAAENASEETLDELMEESGATIVIPLDASVGADGDVTMIRLAEHVAGRGRPVEIETVLCPEDARMLPGMAAFIEAGGFQGWTIDFLGTPGERRGILSSRDARRMFESLAPLVSRMKANIRIREAPSFVRFLAERFDQERHGETSGVVVTTSRESLHVSPGGIVSPGRSLPVPVGDVRHSEIASIQKHSGVLAVLRDPRLLRGRCGTCAFQQICGGSRARAWRVTRDLLAEDPGCFRARGAAAVRVQPVISAISDRPQYP